MGGPNAPVVAHQAFEFAAVDGTVPTLLTVEEARGEDGAEAEERGRALVAEVAADAGLDPDEYDVEVVVSEDVGEAILDALDRYDTVCVGLSGRTEGDRIPFGTVTERVAREAPGNVALVRGS